MADDALIRWENERRDRLGGAIALLFGISSASLAFCGALVSSDSVKQLGGDKTFYFLAAVICFVMALLASVLATLTRLWDARATADIVRMRDDPKSKTTVENLRKKSDCLGDWTWRLFYAQLATLCAGAGFFLFSLWLIFHSKLFP